jgi:hypothetical protein
MIVEKRCPRCGIRRTMLLGSYGSFCYNCRLQWGCETPTTDAGANRSRSLMVAPAYPFSTAELVRLQRYRRAIRQGVFNDWSPSA